MQHFDEFFDANSTKYVMFLTVETYSHGGLQTRKLGQTPLSDDQSRSEQNMYQHFDEFFEASLTKYRIVASSNSRY